MLHGLAHGYRRLIEGFGGTSGSSGRNSAGRDHYRGV